MAAQLITPEWFAELQAAERTNCDIVSLNYYAAHGLPGTESSDLTGWHEKLDDFAARVKVEIRRHIHRMESQAGRAPTEFHYGNSLSRFFCWVLLQVLQEDCGVRYHPDRKFNPDSCEPKDIFVHGILDDDGRGGTCSSMPVVYVSVGRRLGLPLFLVEAPGHAFFRWDSPNGVAIRWESPDLDLWIPSDRFNVEGAGEGIAYYSDAHYKRRRESWDEIDFLSGRFLCSMTAKEELAGFLIERGECFWERKNRTEALRSYDVACRIVPDHLRYNLLHAIRVQQYQKSKARVRAIEGEMAAAERKRLARCPDLGEGCPRPAAPSLKVAGLQFPDHGSHCRCFNCQCRRVETGRPEGFPGHPPHCSCAVCVPHRPPFAGVVPVSRHGFPHAACHPAKHFPAG